MGPGDYASSKWYHSSFRSNQVHICLAREKDLINCKWQDYTTLGYDIPYNGWLTESS